MGKLIETKVNRFDGGMANDIRSKDATKARMIKHFDAYSFPHRLVPTRASESGNDTVGRKMTDFIYANEVLYGMGVVSGTTKVAVYYKNTFTNDAWNSGANSESAVSSAPITGAFCYYKKFIYGVHPNQSVWKYDVSGSAAFVETDLSLSAQVTTLGGMVVHSKDDIMYLAYNTANGPIIAKKNGATWTDSALLLPTDMTVVSICEYGNYLAIACRGADSFGLRSRVFLWDRDSSVTTLAESIDWGYGKISFIEEYNGNLVGVSYQDSAVFSSNRLGPERLVIKVYSGGTSQELVELISDTTSYPTALLGQIYGTKFQKANNRLYFLAGIQIDGAVHNGLWSLCRNESGRYGLQLEYLPNNDTAVTSMEGFYVAGTFAFIAYDGAGAISKTIETISFTATSIYETSKYDAGDISVKKGLVAVSVTTKPLVTGAVVVGKYKMDSDTSWTTFLTHSTLNSSSHSAINIESTGVTFPEFNEIQFRWESTGGAEITGFSFMSDITGKRPY